MKPPARKPGPRSRDRVSSTTKKPKKLSYRSPREARRARKQNVSNSHSSTALKYLAESGSEIALYFTRLLDLTNCLGQPTSL